MKITTIKGYKTECDGDDISCPMHTNHAPYGDLTTRQNRLQAQEERASRIMTRWIGIVALASAIGFYGAHLLAYYLYFY